MVAISGLDVGDFGGESQIWQFVAASEGFWGQIQLVKTKQIHKLMLTMFDPEEIERTKCGVGSSLSLIARKVCNAADAKYRVLKVCMVW